MSAPATWIRRARKGVAAFSNSVRIDAAVSAEVLRAISPLALEAALQMISGRKQARGSERLRQSELALDQSPRL